MTQINTGDSVFSVKFSPILYHSKPVISHSPVSLCCAEEEEYRLTSLMPDYTNMPDVEYMQQTILQRSSKSQRPLPPLPSPQGPPCVGPP